MRFDRRRGWRRRIGAALAIAGRVLLMALAIAGVVVPVMIVLMFRGGGHK